ncbi:MAG: XRE family transcriptional regulator [Acidimicrobiia bacterium]|nr:MAG: XRE family transcriptional regulator [Acidimicrobiia bacterium]
MKARAIAAAFDPRRLELARTAAGILKKDLAAMIQVTPSAVSQFEAGLARPSPITVQRLALALGFPPTFFAHRHAVPEVGSAAHFRSLRSTTQRERRMALAHAVLLWDLVQELAKSVEFPDVGIPQFDVGAGAGLEVIEEIAAVTRQEWSIAPGPVSNVVRHLEAKGTLVTRLTLDTERVNAFSCDIGSRPMVVLAADKNNKERSRFDAAHELGHLVMHQDAEPANPDAERQANSFAAAFLMPEGDIRDELPSRYDLPRFIELKGRWGVSIQALLYRCRTLGRVSDSGFRRSMAAFSSQFGRRTEPGPVGTAERPTLIRNAVDLYISSGRTLEQLADASQVPVRVIADIAALEPALPSARPDGPWESA